MTGSASAGARVNLSNWVTSVRLLCVPFVAHAIVREDWRVACALFWLAVATDLADGRIARARGESTHLGALLDHGSDALFVVVANSACAAAGRVTFALPVLVALAFAQYVLDSRWVAGRPLRASRLGRWNGVLYFVPVGIVVTREALGLAAPGDRVVAALAWALVASTLLSMGDRLLALRRPRG